MSFFDYFCKFISIHLRYSKSQRYIPMDYNSSQKPTFVKQKGKYMVNTLNVNRNMWIPWRQIICEGWYTYRHNLSMPEFHLLLRTKLCRNTQYIRIFREWTIPHKRHWSKIYDLHVRNIQIREDIYICLSGTRIIAHSNR